MPTPEQFLSKRQRYQPISLPQNFSEEEMARDWTLSDSDRVEIGKYRKSSRLFVAMQLCAVRLYRRFCTLLGSPGALFRGVHSRPHRDKIAFAIPIRPLSILYMRLGGSPVHHHRHVDEITEKRSLSNKFRGWDK
jgi:hypothetical protein